jgi:phosphoserine phosphatase
MHAPHDRLQDLLKVLEISRSLVAAVDLGAILQLIIDRSMELLHAERASLFLYDQPRDELVTRVAAGSAEIRVPAGSGIVGAAVREGRTVNVPDAYADARFNREVDRKTGFTTRNILAVPLPDHEGKLVGVLQVLNKRQGAFDDYDVTLAQTLAAQAGVAIQRAGLIEHYIAKQQMERAMLIAREIQQGLLPQQSPTLVGYDISGVCVPADETGGDMFDYLAVGDGRLLVTVADATGHGIGSALVIAETRSILRAVAMAGSAPHEILARANDLLYGDLGGARFVTCFCGVLDGRSGELSYSSAGHGPLLHYSRRADVFTQVPATGLPLGIDEALGFEPLACWRLDAGDIVVVTTDGFFEAADASGEQFGIGRIMEMVRRDRDLSSAAIIENLHAAVRGFGFGPQADDLTALVIRRLPGA